MFAHEVAGSYRPHAGLTQAAKHARLRAHDPGPAALSPYRSRCWCIWGRLAIRWYALAYIAGLVLGWWGVVRVLRRQETLGAAALQRQAARHRGRHRRPGGVGHPGRDPRRAAGLGPDLRHLPVQRHPALCGLLRRAADGFHHRSHPHHRRLGRRHVVSWRTARAWWWRSGCSAAGASSRCWRSADLVCVFAPIGLFFGRIANFVNGELWGRANDVPWAMIFPRDAAASAAPSQPAL